ncbi:Acyl-protein thioesterase 1 [Leucoagaricus sp. SymC.cos]|nr:Acyl-protein thioesterase 1 [Leucoagaricus sp. SymC.cos]
MAAAPIALKFLTVPAITRHTATVIFIHGLGDTGFGWKPVADLFRVDPDLHHVKWILPHSRVQPVTANMGMEMPSWFDIYSFGFKVAEDEKGMLESKKLISQIIVDEINAGTPPSRIFLGGFSQGGAMSLLVGLTGEWKLAGLSILSSWLPLRAKFKAMASPHAASVPIFWGYGTNDSLIEQSFTNASVAFLKDTLGVPPAKCLEERGLWVESYSGMGHETCQKELDALRAFIKKHIPRTA